jgi:hypothetical protein
MVLKHLPKNGENNIIRIKRVSPKQDNLFILLFLCNDYNKLKMKLVEGEDTCIEARNTTREARVSSTFRRVSIPTLTTITD